MSMQIVNGYVCANCTDVAYAKRNIDPHLHTPGSSPAVDQARMDRPAFQLGGALAESESGLGRRRGEDIRAKTNGAVGAHIDFRI